jgi:hypothetical protein
MFLILCGVLIAAWLLGWGVFYVAGGLIHFMLLNLVLVAVIFLILHFRARPNSVGRQFGLMF